MEEKLDTNGKRLEAVELSTKETHDAVLQLPDELQKKFVTRMEFNAVKWVGAMVVLILTVWGIVNH